MEQWSKEPQKVQANAPLYELLVYYFYVNEEFPKFFYLINKTKNLE